MAGQGELSAYIDMAPKAQAGNFSWFGDQVGTCMNRVAIGTGNLVGCMGTAIPVMDVKGGVAGMTLQTNQRFGSGRQGAVIKKVVPVSLQYFRLILVGVEAGDGVHHLAGGAMAGFAVNDHHSGGRLRQLVTHGARLEVQGQFIVGMAALEAVLVADIIGCQFPEKEFFIFLNRHDGLGFL